jgi:hypothetical protein
MSLCPESNSPMPRIMMGVTEIMVIMTTQANTRSVIVARDKPDIKPLYLIFTEQLFLSLSIIIINAIRRYKCSLKI